MSGQSRRRNEMPNSPGSGGMAPTSEILTKAGVTAILAGIGSNILFGDQSYQSLIIGGCAGLGSIANDALSDWVIKKIPSQSPEVQRLETNLVGPSLTGSACAGSLKILYPDIDMTGMFKAGGLGIFSKISGDYLYNTFNISKNIAR